VCVCRAQPQHLIQGLKAHERRVPLVDGHQHIARLYLLAQLRRAVPVAPASNKTRNGSNVECRSAAPGEALDLPALGRFDNVQAHVDEVGVGGGHVVRSGAAAARGLVFRVRAWLQCVQAACRLHVVWLSRTDSTVLQRRGWLHAAAARSDDAFTEGDLHPMGNAVGLQRHTKLQQLQQVRVTCHFETDATVQGPQRFKRKSGSVCTGRQESQDPCKKRSNVVPHTTVCGGGWWLRRVVDLEDVD